MNTQQFVTFTQQLRQLSEKQLQLLQNEITKKLGRPASADILTKEERDVIAKLFAS